MRTIYADACPICGSTSWGNCPHAITTGYYGEYMAPMKILNAFSTSMIPKGGDVVFQNISADEAKRLVVDAGAESAIGHPGTADVFSKLLEKEIPVARVQVILECGEEALIGSLNVRLPEGKVLSTDELRNLPIQWVKVTHICAETPLEKLYFSHLTPKDIDELCAGR